MNSCCACHWQPTLLKAQLHWAPLGTNASTVNERKHKSESQRAFIEVITGQSMLLPSNLTFQYLSIFLYTTCLSIATVTVVMVVLKFSCWFKTESAENRKLFCTFFFVYFAQNSMYNSGRLCPVCNYYPVMLRKDSGIC